MIPMNKIAFTAAVAASFAAASPHAQAEAAALPTFGHYIGYATVAAPSIGCPTKAGDHFTIQLELNTVQNYPVFLTRHAEYNATTGAPVLYKTAYARKSGTKLAPSGAIGITDENTGKAVAGTFSAIYTPFDGNSFGGTIHLAYPNGTAKCTVTHEVVFVRSSAD